MITVIYTEGDVRKEHLFPKTKKGNQQSVKFLEQLAKERASHPWYYKLKKIELLKRKLSDKKLGAVAKKRYQLESELLREEADRKETLYVCDVDCPPPFLKVEIINK